MPGSTKTKHALSSDDTPNLRTGTSVIKSNDAWTDVSESREWCWQKPSLDVV